MNNRYEITPDSNRRVVLFEDETSKIEAYPNGSYGYVCVARLVERRGLRLPGPELISQQEFVTAETDLDRAARLDCACSLHRLSKLEAKHLQFVRAAVSASKCQTGASTSMLIGLLMMRSRR